MTWLLYPLLVAAWLAPLHAETETIRWRQTWQRLLKDIDPMLDQLAAALERERHTPAFQLLAPPYTRPPEQSDVDAAPGMTLDELLNDIDRLTGDTHDC